MKARSHLPVIMAICLGILSAVQASADSFSNSHSPQISFSHISTNEGLSQGTVVSSCQDRFGRMWFATHDGLNMYDGTRFTIYKNVQDDSTSLIDNIIRKVYCDSNGDIWVGTEKGLSYYDNIKDSFRNYPSGERPVTGISQAENGRLMIAAGGKIMFFDTESWSWETERHIGQMESVDATILFRQEDNIWIGTRQDGLFCYSISTKEFRRISAYTCNKSIQCIIMPDDHSLWIATEGDGLYCLDTTDDGLVNFRHSPDNPHGLSSNYVRTLSTDIFGRLWIGTFKGLSILEDGKFTNIYSEPFMPGSLSQASVRCISRDSQGGMWLGTWFGGINYWHPLRNRFTAIQRRANGKGINDNVISCITEDEENSLWIGTNNGGVNHYDSSRQIFSYYRISDDSESENIESNDIKAIYVDKSSGLVYVGAHAGGLNIINRANGKVRHCTNDIHDPAPSDVYSIMPKNERQLWIGTLDGLETFDIATGRFIQTQYNDSRTPRASDVRTILSDSKGRLWTGGREGIICYQPTESGLKHLTPGTELGELDDAFIHSIFESSTKHIWISSRQGLYCFDDRSGRLTRYGAESGLPSDMIFGIEEDSFGRLWISTDNGISCFNPFSSICRNFSIADGLQSNKFNPNSHCRRSSGEMLFGGISGITAFTPEKMEDNPYAPQPILTSLQLFNKAVRPGDESGIMDSNIILLPEISLKHDENSFSIGFSVTNYLSGPHNSFIYTLEGFDKEWYETDGNSVTYSNLPHGKYRFMVKAANNDGLWNDQPTTLEIEIRPAWYETVLANIIYILAIITAISAASRLLLRRKEKENRQELERQEQVHQEELHQMKMRFFINISHEMRTPLTLIINPLQEMISKSNEPGMRKQLKYLERNAKRLLHLVNQLMDYRRAELGVFKLKIQPENVHKIVKENYSFYEKLAADKKIRYTLSSDLEGKMINTDGQYLELILNNLLSNAFKYTDNGEIAVRAYEQEEKLVIEVKDTGTGIPAGQQDKIFERFYQADNEHIGSGIGLSLVQRLVELHHGQIKLISEVGKGSTFTILLPTSADAYTEEELYNQEGRSSHSSSSHEMYLVDTELQEEESEDNEEKKRGCLLIVEDDEEIRNYMKNNLSQLFDIMLAKNGEEALQMMKESLPDIVITDMMMPVMDGRKLCMHIKQNNETCHIPVIMLSAKTDGKAELDALKSGADDFITKPFSMSVLIAKIRNMVRTYHRIHEKATKSMEIAPEKISFNAFDEQILNKAISIVEKNMDNTEFSTEEFAKAMNMSRSNLHLKLKALTGESALDFIRKIRFKEACRLLKDGRYSISEISDMVGFNSPSYFATCFKKHMGCLPTEYIRTKR